MRALFNCLIVCDVKTIPGNTPTTNKALRAQMLAGIAVTE